MAEADTSALNEWTVTLILLIISLYRNSSSARVQISRLVYKLHIYAGLQGLIALGIFSIAALAATFGGTPDENTEVFSYSGKLSDDRLEMARNLHAEYGLRFERVPAAWMVKDMPAGKLKLKNASPLSYREIVFDKTNLQVEIMTRPRSIAQFLNHMHQETLGRRQLSESLWLWAWSLYILASLAALFVFPLTSAYILLSGGRRRLSSNLGMFALGGLFLVLVFLIRTY